MQRIDLWLWHARLARTRTRASALVRAGAVRINKVKTRRPSTGVRPGDVVTLRNEHQVRVCRVEGISDRRLGAAMISRLYTDLLEPVPDAR